MKLRIKSAIWNIRKQKNTHSEQQEEKRIQKTEASVKKPLGQIQAHQLHIRGVPGRGERARNTGNLVEKIMTNFPNLVKEIDM